MTSAERCYSMEREHENACAEKRCDRRKRMQTLMNILADYADLMERTAEKHMELARTQVSAMYADLTDLGEMLELTAEAVADDSYKGEAIKVRSASSYIYKAILSLRGSE